MAIEAPVRYCPALNLQLVLNFLSMIIPENPILNNRCEAVEIIEREMKPANRKAFTSDDVLFMLAWPVLKFAAAAMPENRWADVAMRIERTNVWLGQQRPGSASAGDPASAGPLPVSNRRKRLHGERRRGASSTTFK
jgi:hypothetical protein